MPKLFVLDAPEFRPIVEVARTKPGLTVTGPKAGYFSVSTQGDLRMDRAETGLSEALWFGAVTGGYRGAGMTLDGQTLLIRGGTEPA